MYTKLQSKDMSVATDRELGGLKERVGRLESTPAPNEVVLVSTLPSNTDPVANATSIYIKHGVHYIINSTSSTGNFNFSNLKLLSGTAEIHIRFTSTATMPNVILPSDWVWIGTELPSSMTDNTTYVVALRNEGYTDGAFVAPTVANVAYSYKRETN